MFDIRVGDMRVELDAIEADSIDACVTDPPYHLTSIVKRFGAEGAAPAKVKQSGVYERSSRGFMGQTWDGGDVAFQPETWARVLRVLKPGGHLLAFGGTRTYHRLVCAIEDAGFEIRDQFAWLYGSGFPKSHDVSKGIDRAAGAKREVVGKKTGRGATPVQDLRGGAYAGGHGKNGALDCSAITAPATEAARQWQGFGTALKPALEPVCLARKPLSERTIAANVLRWRTGALNIDGCRVGIPIEKRDGGLHRGSGSTVGSFTGEHIIDKSPAARWPANVIHDGSDEVTAGFPETTSGALNEGHKRGTGINFNGGGVIARDYGNDSGSAARFFYCAKASKADRSEGNNHPTVKPTKLMRYLCRLVTPPGGIILDPFMGSGSTGKAAMLEGFRFIGCEMKQEYADIARARIAAALPEWLR